MTGRDTLVDGPRLIRYRDLADLIARSPARCGGTRLVAVDGPGGAGKSVFARRLAASLGDAPVIPTDDFASWETPLDWWDRLEEQVLLPLERGERVRYQAYHWVGHKLGTWHDVPHRGVVVVEGVSSSRLAVVDRLTTSIWIETPPDQRLARGIARDGEAMRPAWDGWMAEEDAHFANDGARERAQVIVDGSPSVPHDPEQVFVATRLSRLPGGELPSA